MPGALEGVKVLDLSRIVAGPSGAQMLADLGADVIKVERTGDGDEAHRFGPSFLTDAEGREVESTYCAAVNRGKRSIQVDFQTPGGVDVVRRLAAGSDVLLENYRAGALDRYGLGWDDLSALNPGLVYCSVTGFGLDGPYAARPGYDYLAQAMGGLMSLTGHPDGEPGDGPMRVGIPIADVLAGINAVVGILAALNHRHRTGEGQRVSVALLEAQMAALMNPASAWLNAGHAFGRAGNEHPSAVPYGVFETADRPILIAVVSDREFARMAAAMGRPDWTADPRFADRRARNANRAAFLPELKALLATRGADHWVDAMDRAVVPCGPVNAMPDLFADAHVQARGMVVDLPHRDAGTMKAVASPIRLSATPVAYRRGPPMPGEHTDEVLAERLGLDAEAIAALRAAGAIQ